MAGGMCPFYFSFSDECIIKGQPTYMPLIEQRLTYCLTDKYSECLRFKSFSQNEQPCIMERREYRRTLRQLNGVVFGPDKKSEIETVDISVGGARIRSTAYISPGKCVDMMIRGQEKKELEVHGCVRWASNREEDGKWSLGIQFNPVPEGDAMRTLESFVWNGEII